MTQRKMGFAVMPKEALRAITSLGGKAAHKAGTAHQFTPEEARIAGSKGGLAAAANRRAARAAADKALEAKWTGEPSL